MTTRTCRNASSAGASRMGDRTGHPNKAFVVQVVAKSPPEIVVPTDSLEQACRHMSPRDAASVDQPRRDHLPASQSALMRCLRIAEGLKTITRREVMDTSLPVLGLRPILWPFLRTTKEPKEDSFTVSPRSRQSVISVSTNSTRVSDSV